MNVLQFADYSAPYEGNFIVSLKELEENLKKQNIEVVYLFPESAKEQMWAKDFLLSGRHIYFINGGILNNILPMIKIIREHNIRIIHTHFSVLKFDMIIKIARLLSKKTIYIRHMHMLYKNKKNVLLEKAKRFISNADIEITCGSAAYIAMQQAGFKPENLFNVTNAIDFNRLLQYQPINRKELGISESTKIILMFGYNYLTKGVDIAIKAVQAMIAENYDVALLVVVAKGDQIIANQITQEFGEALSYIKIIPPRSDIAAYYKIADIFLSASRFESFCYAVREAAYLECLTVVSDIPAHKMTEYDITFESGNDIDLARILKAMIENHDNSAIISKQKEFCVKEYSIEKWCDDIAEIYKSLI